MFEISGGMDIKFSVDMGSVRGEKGDKGDKGDVGKGFAILGTYATLSALEAGVTDAQQGDFYNVGSSAPYTIYMWDGKQWQSQGQLQGPVGAHYTPSVSESGLLRWTNNGGLPNPASVNIKGPKGDKGDTGDTGATGATGATGGTGPAGPNSISEETATALTGILKGNGSTVAAAVAGTDYVAPVAGKGLSTNDYTTAEKDKLADLSKPVAATAELPATGWDASAKTQTVNVSGVTATNSVIVQAAPASRTAWLDAGVYCSAQGAGTLTFTCDDVPESALTANVLIVEVAE